jgi:hypothetical protein
MIMKMKNYIFGTRLGRYIVSFLTVLALSNYLQTQNGEEIRIGKYNVGKGKADTLRVMDFIVKDKAGVGYADDPPFYIINFYNDTDKVPYSAIEKSIASNSDADGDGEITSAELKDKYEETINLGLKTMYGENYRPLFEK